MTSYPSAYLEFIRLFNERNFFEAHEVLESLWQKETGRERDFFHGLIQIAALFVHLQKKNLLGAERLLKTASVYLTRYVPRHCGIQVSAILEQAHVAITAVAKEMDIPVYLIEIDS